MLQASIEGRAWWGFRHGELTSHFSHHTHRPPPKAKALRKPARKASRSRSTTSLFMVRQASRAAPSPVATTRTPSTLAYSARIRRVPAGVGGPRRASPTPPVARIATATLQDHPIRNNYVRGRQNRRLVCPIRQRFVCQAFRGSSPRQPSAIKTCPGKTAGTGCASRHPTVARRTDPGRQASPCGMLRWR